MATDANASDLWSQEREDAIRLDERRKCEQEIRAFAHEYVNRMESRSNRYNARVRQTAFDILSAAHCLRKDNSEPLIGERT